MPKQSSPARRPMRAPKARAPSVSEREARDRTASRLGMNDHVGDLGTFGTDARLDLARAGMCVRERSTRIEPERQEGDEPLGRVQEPQLAWRSAEHIPDDSHNDGRLGVHVLRRLYLDVL